MDDTGLMAGNRHTAGFLSQKPPHRRANRQPFARNMGRGLKKIPVHQPHRVGSVAQREPRLQPQNLPQMHHIAGDRHAKSVLAGRRHASGKNLRVGSARLPGRDNAIAQKPKNRQMAEVMPLRNRRQETDIAPQRIRNIPIPFFCAKPDDLFRPRGSQAHRLPRPARKGRPVRSLLRSKCIGHRHMCPGQPCVDPVGAKRPVHQLERPASPDRTKNRAQGQGQRLPAENAAPIKHKRGPAVAPDNPRHKTHPAQLLQPALYPCRLGDPRKIERPRMNDRKSPLRHPLHKGRRRRKPRL